MWDSIASSELWGHAGTGVAWVVTICLLIAGAVGCVLPVLPGHLILLIAAIAHRLMLGREGSGLEWWSFVVLGVLMVVSQTMEMISGAAGARWFGGTRWGAAGALVGSIVGMFFMPFGLLLGPLIGAIACELVFARQESRPAAVSGVGSVVGVIAGMVIKVAIGVLMLAWFFADVFLIG
jgi:uncharacterized protein YqgC (DUF456 family)